MANIIACYKWVVNEQDIKIDSASLKLDMGRAKYKISDYDRNAIEEGTKLHETLGGSFTCLTFGTKQAKTSLKDALSRGPENAVWVNDEQAETADAFVTSNVLAAAIQQIGNYDLILCGEGSSDQYAQQVGPRLASLLNIPAVTFVSKLTVEGNQITCERKLGDSVETVKVQAPALITVLPEINKARIPGLKQVLGAAKKPMKELKLSDLNLSESDLAPKAVRKEVKGYVMNRKNVLHNDGNLADNVKQVVASLIKDGVL